MIGTKFISDLITSPDVLKPGRINIIDAPVSAGKTTFALGALPQWAGSPERILYLIDTNNGEFSIQRNTITTNRFEYSIWDYNTKSSWGENTNSEKLPVMTYSGFGAEVIKNEGNFHIFDFDYIVCDEL